MNRQDFTLIVSLGVIALSLTLSLFKSNTINQQGYTQKEVNYLLEIQNLKNETKTLHYEIEKFKEGIISDSIFIHNSTTKQIDSLFSSYFGS